MTDEKYMRHAVAEAKVAKEEGEWPFGAVIVRNNEVISMGHCRESKTRNVLMHAETQTVSSACTKLSSNKLNDCVIYCTNEPCPMCAAAIFQAKIGRVVIGATRDDLAHLFRKRALSINELALDSGYPIEITRGILKNEVLDLFSSITK